MHQALNAVVNQVVHWAVLLKGKGGEKKYGAVHKLFLTGTNEEGNRA
jgi:hypothetical protein